MSRWAVMIHNSAIMMSRRAVVIHYTNICILYLIMFNSESTAPLRLHWNESTRSRSHPCTRTSRRLCVERPQSAPTGNRPSSWRSAMLWRTSVTNRGTSMSWPGGECGRGTSSPSGRFSFNRYVRIVLTQIRCIPIGWTSSVQVCAIQILSHNLSNSAAPESHNWEQNCSPHIFNFISPLIGSST